MIGQMPFPAAEGIPDARALLAEMDYLGIERALFFHYAFGMEAKQEMNRLTLAAARQSDRLIPTWVLATSLLRVGVKLEDQVDRMLEGGARAARVFPDEGPSGPPLSLKIYLLEKVLERMNQHRVPLLIPDEYLHSQSTPQSRPPRVDYEDIDAICRNFPDLPVVLLQPSCASQPEVLALGQRHRNFHFSIPVYGLFREMENTAKIIGAERLLFGTNLPALDPSLGIGMVLYAAMSDGDKALIAGGNLKRLLESVR
jgi:predicted TIM-barrel fold metal-dependent hydrolase